MTNMTTQSDELLGALDRLLEAELSGVVRYLHYSFMVFGPNRIPIIKWLRDQAAEGLAHATTIGEKITAYGGHPSVKVQAVPETFKHSVMEILEESLQFEEKTLAEYVKVLDLVSNDIPLSETIRAIIVDEAEHVEEVKKMIRK